MLPPLEYAVVLAILAGIIIWGFLIGVVIGLVLAVVLFAVSYGRIELVREVSFGETYRSNVDRPASERAELRGLTDRVQILRVSASSSSDRRTACWRRSATGWRRRRRGSW